jgi:hypothetical protein
MDVCESSVRAYAWVTATESASDGSGKGTNTGHGTIDMERTNQRKWRVNTERHSLSRKRARILVKQNNSKVALDVLAQSAVTRRLAAA